jgi:hypothetical protein
MNATACSTRRSDMQHCGQEVWVKRVERWKDSGPTSGELAAEMGINPRTLIYGKWRRNKQATATARLAEAKLLSPSPPCGLSRFGQTPTRLARSQRSPIRARARGRGGSRPGELRGRDAAASARSGARVKLPTGGPIYVAIVAVDMRLRLRCSGGPGACLRQTQGAELSRVLRTLDSSSALRSAASLVLDGEPGSAIVVLTYI